MLQVATTSGHVIVAPLINMSSNGSVGFPASKIISCGLRFRMKLKPKDIMFVGEHKRGVIVEESYGHCAKQHINGTNLGIEQPRKRY